MQKIHYRPEIDGLRAIAVISVILYHSQIILFNDSWLEGGFIGVDIFFVISGYLISKIILKELFESRSFNFISFYKRRVKRILPMLLVTILVTFPLGWLFLLPQDFIEFSKSIVSSLLFISNFFFYFSTTEYAAADSLLKPFLHTWSLSIEEQFYIFFPILLVTAYTFSRKKILLVFLLISILSIFYADYLSKMNGDINFFHPFSRCWELLAGFLVAYTDLKFDKQRFKTIYRFIPLTGIILVCYALLYFNHKTPHPSFQTFIPVLGTSIIILFSNKHEIVGKILGSKPFVAIGLISYSLYLWHFPIFAISRIKYGPYDNFPQLIALTFLLSIFSYYLIEKPFRSENNKFSKYSLHLIGFILFVVLTINVINIHQKGFPARVPAIFTNENFKQKVWYRLKLNGKKCFARKENFCTFKESDTDNWVHLIGDSHMAALESDLVKRLKKSHNILTASAHSCWPAIDSNKFTSGPSSNPSCDKNWQNHRINTIYKNGINSTIVIAGRLPLYLNNSFFDNQEGGIENNADAWKRNHTNLSKKTIIKQISTTIDAFLTKGYKVIMVYPIPEAGWNVPQKLNLERPINNLKLNEYLLNKPITTSYSRYLERSKESFEFLDNIKHKNFHRVYPHSLFCDKKIKGRCITHNTENIFYADDDHPSSKGAELINDLIYKKIIEIDNK